MKEPILYEYHKMLMNALLPVDVIDEMSFSLIRAFSWVIPTNDVLDKVSKYQKIVELGSGKGYWANLLAQRGVEVHCYDLHPKEESFYPVKKAGPHVLKNYDTPWVLMICSPQYRSDMVLEALRYYPGEDLVYLGDTQFSLNLPSVEQELKDNWEVVKECDLPNWLNCKNKLVIYRRK